MLCPENSGWSLLTILNCIPTFEEIKETSSPFHLDGYCEFIYHMNITCHGWFAGNFGPVVLHITNHHLYVWQIQSVPKRQNQQIIILEASKKVITGIKIAVFRYLSYIMSIRDSLLISFISASVESVVDKNSSSSAGGVLGGVIKASSV